MDYRGLERINTDQIDPCSSLGFYRLFRIFRIRNLQHLAKLKKWLKSAGFPGFSSIRWEYFL
jgi:hypothetical protein